MGKGGATGEFTKYARCDENLVTKIPGAGLPDAAFARHARVFRDERVDARVRFLGAPGGPDRWNRNVARVVYVLCGSSAFSMPGVFVGKKDGASRDSGFADAVPNYTNRNVSGGAALAREHFFLSAAHQKRTGPTND